MIYIYLWYNSLGGRGAVQTVLLPVKNNALEVSIYMDGDSVVIRNVGFDVTGS